jgi:hypothetical protein
MAFRPAKVHPEEHLRPVGRLRPARPCVDADEGVPLVVLAAEEEQRPLAGVVGGDRGGVALQLGGKLGIPRFFDERDELDEVVGASRQVAPQVDLGAQAVGLPEDPLRRALVVPEAGLPGQRFELAEAFFLGG